MGLGRRTMAAALIIGTGFALAGPAGAAPAAGAKDVTPIFECAAPNSDGSYTAFFSYDNRSTEEVQAPVGGQNQFTSPPKDRGQPTTFAPGRHVAVFGTRFQAGDTPQWHLGNKSAKANTTTLCSAPAELAENSTWLALPAASVGSVIVWGLLQRRRRSDAGTVLPAA